MARATRSSSTYLAQTDGAWAPSYRPDLAGGPPLRGGPINVIRLDAYWADDARRPRRASTAAAHPGRELSNLRPGSPPPQPYVPVSGPPGAC